MQLHVLKNSGMTVPLRFHTLLEGTESSYWVLSFNDSLIGSFKIYSGCDIAREYGAGRTRKAARRFASRNEVD